ncbi:MAG TPA: hypothetical protein VGM47_07780 [Gammaproteobacteria bacterium]
MLRNKLAALWGGACVALMPCIAAAATSATIPTTALEYREVKLTDHAGGVFALGFMPFNAGKFYWGSSEGGAGHLHVYDLVALTAKEMFGVIPASVAPTGFAWSPDGRHAAISQISLLRLMDINTHAVHSLFLGGQGQVGGMFWTPNHTIITSCAPAEHAPRRLCVVDTVRGLVTVLAVPDEGSVIAMGYIEGANKLIYENAATKVAAVQLHLGSVYADRVGNVISLSYPDIGSDGNLAVTLDGAYGVAIGQQGQSKSSDIYLGDLDTGDWVRIPSPSDWGQPVMTALSPDHAHLLVASLDGKGGYRLWLADVPAKLTASLAATH